jgi:hypothetical protein
MEPTVYVPWQLSREIARLRLEDTARSVRYAHRTVKQRRPRRIAARMRRLAEWLGRAVPRRGADIEAPVGRAPTDVTLSVAFEGNSDDSHA